MSYPSNPSKKSGFPVKWLVFGVIVGVAIYYGPGLLHSGAKGGAEQQQGGGVPVSVSEVISKPITHWNEFSGILQAVHSVEIRPRIGGQIMNVNFKDGSEVKKGQLLFAIDARPYEAAQITAKAAYSEAELSYGRSKKLLKSKAISRAEFDTAESAYNRALGNLKAADVNVAYTQITAPISGKISRAEVTEGNLVDAGASAPLLASIVTVSPIYASFDIDEQTFLSSIQGVAAAKLKTIPVEVALGNGGQGELVKATIHSFDNQIAPGSGTIRVRALLENKDASLIPGLFAKVRIGSADQVDSVLINPTAVATDQSKKFVMVVDAENKAEYREVTLGSLTDGLQIIATGLKPGEKIIVNGLQRVRPGVPVMGTEVDMTTLKPLNPPAEAPAADGGKPAEEKPADNAAAN